MLGTGQWRRHINHNIDWEPNPIVLLQWARTSDECWDNTGKKVHYAHMINDWRNGYNLYVVSNPDLVRALTYNSVIVQASEDRIWSSFAHWTDPILNTLCNEWVAWSSSSND